MTHTGGSTSTKGPSSRTRTFPRLLLIYTATTAFAAAAFAIRQVLSLAVGPGLPPYITFYPAVMLVAVMAGVGPGLLETAIAAFIAVYWILPVQGHFALARPADALGLAIFLSMGVFMSVVAELYRRARQKAAESEHMLELQKSETRFSTVFHANPLGMSITRLVDGQYLDANQSFLSLFGFVREEVLGHTALELQTWVAPEEREHLIRTLREQGSAQGIETRRRRKSGEILTLLISAEEIEVSGERCMMTLLQDITDRKRAETSLQESERRFRGTLENMLEGCQILGFDWQYLYLNKAAQEHNRRPNEELMGKKYADMWPGIEATEVFQMIRRCMEERLTQRMENEFVFPDGTVGWFELNIQAVPEGVFILSEDITERKHSEKALRESQEHYRSLFTNMLNGFAFCKMLYEDGRPHDFIYTEVNDAFTALTGLKDVTGKKVSEVIPGIRESDPRLFEIYGRVAQTGTPERFESFVQALEMWFSISVYCPQKGYFVAIFDVITERKRSEKELEQRVQNRTAELKAANEELEAFSYSVSHDLRAPLRHISGFLDLLQRSAGEALDQKAERYLGIIKDSARQMGVLIDDLLAFSKIGRASFTAGPVPLEPLVAEVISDLSHAAAGRDVKWIVKDLPQVQGDRNLLKLVLTNLLDNALKYTRTRETAVIEVSSEKRGDARVVQVRDNGVGFDPRGAEKLFGVFQRLHSASEFEGTGIGLANVRRIVTRHGGNTWAESELGKGSTFSFSLPEKG